jgi:serine/threonine protein kinase
MNSPDNSETVELRIADVVAHWMECSVSTRPSIQQLIDNHPDLAPGLGECLGGLEQIEKGISATSLSVTTVESRCVDRKTTELPKIPDFELLRELGRGGMGVVYEARQISLDRIVALKVLPFGSIDASTVKRFLREAETVASLTHPGIVPVYSVGVDGGLHWYAMQRIDGCTLSQWFALATFHNRAATLAEVVRVGFEAADALHYAHGCGVIHRDVKPNNLLVDTAGKVWLADFGLARRDVDVTATATGAMLGTPRYMSAEQVSGRDDQIDARTDIYSLGATLYEMATGRPPFTSESPLDLLMQIRRDEPIAPRKLDPSIPRTLEIVILKCLDKEAGRRYDSAAALAEDLRAIRDEKPIKAQGLPAWVTASRFLNRYRTQFKATAMTAVVTIATITSLILLWQQYKSDQQGFIRIDSPAGLYVASIQAIESRQQLASNNSSTRVQPKPPDPIVLTTPMQQTLQLPAGNYVARLAGDGNVSQEIILAVQSQLSSEFRYIDRRERPMQVDIHQKLAVPLGQDTLAVLGSQSFELFDPHDSSLEGMRRFSLPITQLDEGLSKTEADTSSSTRTSQDDPTLTFAFDSNQKFQGDHSAGNSGFARIQRIATNQVDLDGDGRLDFLVTAARHAAIAAISSNGNILWKKRLPIGVQPKGPSNTASMREAIHEAIVGIDTTEDLDGDGTFDLVLNAAAFDPAGSCNPHLCTLSGRTGSQLSIASFPTVDMQSARTWPWAGLLRYQRFFGNDNRNHRPIMEHQFSMRSKTSSLNGLNWGGMHQSSALYTLPTPVFTKHAGSRVALTATKQQVHTINLENGSEAYPSIDLNEPIHIAPRHVRLADGKTGVIVLTGTGNMSCTLHLCELGAPKPRWSIPQTLAPYDLVAGASPSTLPMGIDLDGDGVDEILATSNTTRFVGWPLLECYSSANGRLMWQSQQIAGIAQIVEHLLPVGDVDGDNFVDLAAVGLNYQGISTKQSRGNELPDHDLRLSIDFLSGKNGQRLGYREERIAASVKNAAVVEIDFAKIYGQELLCSIVYGSADELELSSASIAVDLTNLRSPLLFPGLTSLKPIHSQTGIAQGWWFRDRSGPFASPNDNACWIARNADENLFQNQHTLAAWTSQSGHPRIVLSDQNSIVRCIDAATGSTIWQNGLSQLMSPLVHQRTDGQVDLVSRIFETGGPKLAFIESETGRVRFSISEPSIDRVLSITPDYQSPNFAYCYAVPEMGKMFMGGRRHFWLMKIDLVNGQLIWSQECLEGIDPNGFTKPAIPIQCDINEDNVTDLIVSNTQSGELVLQAIDGRNGRPYWSAPLNQSVSDWPSTPSWPMMKRVGSGEQEYILVVDKSDAGDNFFALKSIRLSDGKKCDELVNRGIYGFKGNVQTRSFAFYEISPAKRDGIVALATPHPFDDPTSSKSPNQSDTFGWKILKVDENKGTIKQEFVYGSPKKFFVADVDGDSSFECISITRDGAVTVSSLSAGESVGSFSLPKGGEPLRVEQIGDKWYLLVLIRKKEFQWMELPTGRLAASHGGGLQEISHPTELPRILKGTGGDVLVGTTPESTVTAVKQLASVEPQTATLLSKPIAMISTKLDSRYMRPVSSLGLYRERSLAEIVRLALLSIGAVLLPARYLFGMIRYRQWSLQSMLLAPAITLVALVCWRSLASVQSNPRMIVDIIAGTLAILSIWAVYAMLQLRQWKILAMTLLLSGIVGTLMALGAQSMANSNTGIVGYWTFGTWFSSVCAAAAQIAVPIGLGQAVAQHWSKKGKAS